MPLKNETKGAALLSNLGDWRIIILYLGEYAVVREYVIVKAPDGQALIIKPQHVDGESDMTRKFPWYSRFFVAGMALIFLCSVSGLAQADSVSDLLSLLPEDAHFAVALPNIAGVEKEAAPILALPFASDVEMAAAMLGGDTLAEGLDNVGIDVNQPGAVFVRFESLQDLRVGGVLQVKDEGALVDFLTGIIGSSAEDVDLPGGRQAKFVDSSKVGYFLQGNKVFIGSSIAMLNRMSDRIESPRAVRYAPGTREEVVAFTRMDLLDGSGLLDSVPELDKIKPLLDTIRPFSDELLLAIGEKAGKAYLRAAAHDTGNAPLPSPGPLGFHGFLNADAPLVANLRLTPELTNCLSLLMVQEPSTRKVGGYIRIVSGMLGDELALGLNGIEGKIPDAVLAAKVEKADLIPGILKTFVNIEAPSYQLDGSDVYVYEKVSKDTDLHIAIAGNTLVVAPAEDMLTTSVKKFNQPSGATGVDAATVAEGVYGFVALDGAKALDAFPKGTFPSNLDMSKVSLALTLGLDGEWREAVLSSPKGFDGFASLLDDIL
jgi:hypothetical protein